MAETEICVQFTKEKQVEMEPSISTPLQQEAKRKRLLNNGTSEELSRRKKKPRKKIYRPKVIGEGRKRKNKGSSITPTKPKTPNPKITRTRKLVPCHNNNAEIKAKEDLVLVENVEVIAIEAKEVELETADEAKEEEDEDNSKSIVVRTPDGLSETCNGSFCLTQECKRKRSSRRMKRRIIEKKLYGLMYVREKGRGSRKKLLPFLYSKRKRTQMVRRCNLASLFAIPVCNQLPRNVHKCVVESEKAESFNGSDIVPIVRWQLKKPRNRPKSQATSNCSSRDDDGGRKIEELVCQSPIDLNVTVRDTYVGAAITDVNKEDALTKGTAQTLLSQSNARETSIGTALTDVNKEETLTKVSTQSSLSRTNGKGTFVGTTSITYGNKEETLTKGPTQTSLPRASSKFSDARSEGDLKKMGNLFLNKKLSKHNEQLTMRWLDIRHFLTNSNLINVRSEKNPPKKGLPVPRIITGSRTPNLTRQQDFTHSARPSGNANKLRPTLSMVLWDNREGIRSNHEHIKLTGETRANNKGVLGEETDSFHKRLLVPYVADGRYNGALFGNVSSYVGTNNNTGLSHHSPKEGTDSVHEKQIIPYARKRGKKNSKHIPHSLNGMQGAIVPHPKLTKKKELGRVHLDPRDITVWKVLFENDSNSGKEKVDDEWWENERKVFQGRINAFNAIMHVILGDRRFSPWKGSVVDSVVGVFLTQNVSDHLSSSAYMSLAATFPLPETENYHGEEIFCIEQSTQRNEGLFLCESKLNNGSMMEINKAAGDPEQAKELMSVDVAISSQDCGTCLSKNLDGTVNSVLHSNKSTFEQEPYSSSQNSTSSCGNNPGDTTHTPKSKSGLENNAEDSKRCEEMAVDLKFTPNEKSQGFIGSLENFQNQEIQLTGDVNAKCSLCFESNDQIKNVNAGSQLLGDIDNSSQKLDFDVEKVKSQESVNQASDNTDEFEQREKKEAKRNLEDRNPNHLNDEKETDMSKGKAKKSKMKQEVDWNSLREKWDCMRRNHPACKPRSRDHMDSVDWEAVRSAEPIKIADAIKERGQHNIIAGRIKDFLDRTARLHGCIDLEWLRQAPSKDVKEYLLEIDGLGLKSVECIRLLALQQVAFPVDINVGRIAVRLGWVPLEPLPEEVQMHLLETFPMMDSIQKYLWPRLNVLDQPTLYELHYQLITFGKVFCTKRKPNCNACPLRADCRHYASAYASARLALPGLPEKGIVSTMAPDKSFEGTAQGMNPASLLHIDANPFSGASCETNNCEPIIEQPPSPEPAYDESQLTDIEDFCEYDSDDVPIIRLSSGQFTTTSLNCMDDNITRALVPLDTKAASIPMCKLKRIERLRTEHQAYELPDTHPLLSQLERREPNDPCPYLLCILSPGETVDSSKPSNTRCTYEEMGEICTDGSCSSCDIAREQNSGTVRGTILIPCRTAMRGKFPLNGTYFQVNEVFADDETSRNPIHVPREWIWDLPRRITYFGTSTTTIFRGLAMEEIQYCFLKGFICVRGFNRRRRIPKRLTERLHRPTTASIKARANKNEN